MRKVITKAWDVVGLLPSGDRQRPSTLYTRQSPSYRGPVINSSPVVVKMGTTANCTAYHYCRYGGYTTTPTLIKKFSLFGWWMWAHSNWPAALSNTWRMRVCFKYSVTKQCFPRDAGTEATNQRVVRIQTEKLMVLFKSVSLDNNNRAELRRSFDVSHVNTHVMYSTCSEISSCCFHLHSFHENIHDLETDLLSSFQWENIM